jgi:hypothetical protein
MKWNDFRLKLIMIVLGVIVLMCLPKEGNGNGNGNLPGGNLFEGFTMIDDFKRNVPYRNVSVEHVAENVQSAAVEVANGNGNHVRQRVNLKYVLSAPGRVDGMRLMDNVSLLRVSLMDVDGNLVELSNRDGGKTFVGKLTNLNGHQDIRFYEDVKAVEVHVSYLVQNRADDVDSDTLNIQFWMECPTGGCA